jgi:release factor glutamine methyltransferase
VRDAPAHLEPGAWLLFEHGWDQGPAARAILQQNGFVDIFTATDLERRDRVSGARAGAPSP